LVESLKFKAARYALTFLCVAAFVSASVRMLRAARPDNPPADVIGAIEGDSILVQGPMSVESADGQVKTLLRSGSDVHVKSGQAHIDLPEGGNITICGPAHFSILKSGTALTIALDNGTIHALIEGSLTLNVYTAQIQAHPLAIAGNAQDVLVGLNSSGAMCFRANKGAVRIEQQLTGQSLLVPQNGDVSLANGQLETLQNSPGHCACELQFAKAAISTQVSGLASPEDPKKKLEDSKPVVPQPAAAAPAPTEGPIYQVFMPPLHYDAHTKVEQDFDAKLIVLVRRARVRPTLIYQGKVEGDPVVAQASPPPAAPSVQKSDDPKKAVPDDSTWNRVRSFFHKLWSPTT
jgi:hypothetical protein